MSSSDNNTLDAPTRCPRCDKPVTEVKTWRNESLGQDEAQVICKDCSVEFRMINAPPYPKPWTVAEATPTTKRSVGTPKSRPTKKVKEASVAKTGKGQRGSTKGKGKTAVGRKA